LIIHVKDQGRGIPKEELEPIFKRFYRTGERVEGSTFYLELPTVPK